MKDLLLLLCHYPFEEKNREPLTKLLQEVQDWNKTVSLINDHGIIALAAYNIKEAGLAKEIPIDAMTVLENGYMLSVVRNAWLTERWKEVDTILSGAGIRHILLKGMALEHTLYGSKGLRQMTDNDIYINPDESLKAWKLLQQHGFKMRPLKSSLFRKIIFELGQHLPALFKDDYAVEIHDNLFDIEDYKEFNNINPFDSCVEINLSGHKALIPEKDIHLSYLMEHFEKHKLNGECQLRMYADIKLLDSKSKVEFSDSYISEPKQGYKTEFRKAAYKTTLRSIPSKHRLWFILGDMFPSVKWMMVRYKCNMGRAILYYPKRIGKLWWLV